MAPYISSLKNAFILASFTAVAGCATSDGLSLRSCQFTHERKVFDIKNPSIPAGDNKSVTINIEQPLHFTSVSAVNEACEEAKMTAALALTESTSEKLNPRSAAAAQLAISRYITLSNDSDSKTAEFNGQVLGFLPLFLRLGGFDLEKVSLAAKEHEIEETKRNQATKQHSATPADNAAGNPAPSNCRKQSGLFFGC